MLFSFAACSDEKKENSDTIIGDDSTDDSDTASKVDLEPVDSIQTRAPQSGDTVATIKTSMGDIKVKLFPEYAPKAVENFTTHAKNGYYDGLTFHRVMSDFMIQGGDPEGNGTGGESIWGYDFEDEFSPEMHNIRGALSMANSGANTNGSQFFIVQATKTPPQMLEQMEELTIAQGFPPETVENYKKIGGTPWLDFVHTVFGYVYEGMDVVDAIANVETDASEGPFEGVKISKMVVERL